MKTALITTTINVPTVLALYRKLDSDVKFYVAADEKTPLEAYEFCANISDCEIYSPDRQKELGYECSELLGWNNDSRRNIALLEALKDGAELVVSVDDDMIPLREWNFADRFEYPFDGIQIGHSKYWSNLGQLTIPAAKQRGLPAEAFWAGGVEAVIDAEIGAVQGIILGAPDTDAMTAIVNGPVIHSASDVLRNGFVVHPEAHSVFNSQFTAFRRELAPAFAQFYNYQGRNTDIFASMLMRRIMQERNLYTYFGPPMGFHARKPRPLFNDLKAEMFGLEYIADWADYLAHAPLRANQSVVEQCSILMNGYNHFSDDLKQVADAFYRDCERVL